MNLARSGRRFVVKGDLDGGRIRIEQGMDELPWVDALPSGGFQQTGKAAVGEQSAFRPGSEPDPAEDHQTKKDKMKGERTVTV
jgi:hypothetical protein